MSQANISLKFGNPQPFNRPSSFSAVVEMHKDRIEDHYKKYSTLLKKYRLPLVVMDIPKEFQKVKQQMISKMLGSDVNTEQLIIGNRCYNMYQPKTPEQMVFMRKLQKMLQNMTALDNNCYVNVRLFDLTEKRKLLVDKKVPFGALLLENLQVEANLQLDSEFAKMFGTMVAKISPGFDQSPLMGFLELFSDAGIRLEFENPSTLKAKTCDDLFPDLIGFEEPDDSEEGKLLKQMLQSELMVTLYIHVGKLGYVKMVGEARIWACLLCTA